MPIYRYACRDCEQELEILHPVDGPVDHCGLDCLRRDAGPFGQGEVEMLLSAPNIGRRPLGSRSPDLRGLPGSPAADASREALRRRALDHLGSDTVTEAELDRLRDGGMTVYRRAGKGRWKKDGGAAEAPPVIGPDKDD